MPDRVFLLEAIRGVLDEMVENADWVLRTVNESALEDPALFDDGLLVRAVTVLRDSVMEARKVVGQ